MPTYTDPAQEAKYQEYLRISRRLKADEAKQGMLPFCQLMRPDPEDIERVDKSQFEATPLARLLCQIIEKIDRGEQKRVAVSVGPQFGKSDVLSRMAPAWLSGRNPRRNLILGSYNNDFAMEFGGDVRAIMQAHSFSQVFPEHALRKGSEAKDLLITEAGGKMAFVGIGGSGTGKPADVFFIDDPFKSDEDAQSAVYREKVWKWFTSTSFTRCHKDSTIVIVHCLTGDTRILMADGREKELRYVKPNDNVATYKDGKLDTSTVLNWKTQGHDRVFTIRMKSGIFIKANARHPFLVCKSGEEIWRRTDLLKKGDRIRRVTGVNGAELSALLINAKRQPSAKECVTRTITRNDGQKESGRPPSTLVRGVERIYATATGSLLRTMKSFFETRTGCARYAVDSPLRRTIKRFGAESFLSIIATIVEKSGGCSVTSATLLLGTEEQKLPFAQPLTTLEITDDEIVEVIESGTEEVFDIQVAETENFIANGLVSHNTRWHEDDLIGRLCDPDHPERNKLYKGIAERWTYYNLPAIIQDADLAAALGLNMEVPQDPFIREQFGTKPMVSLWENRKSLAFLAEAKMIDARTFNALYMGKPSPDEGTYFHKDDLVEYHSMDDLPKELRKYGASDHAVSGKQRADSTVLGCVGVDTEEDIWVLPDLIWEKMETDKTVENLIVLLQEHNPECWWLESELISKSFGPFLKKRMHEEKIYTTLIPKTPSKDKRTRARAIQGRMRQKRVHFPAFAPWWPEAKQQLLKFDYGAHDDFVDFMSWIGLGLASEYGASQPKDTKVVKTGTLAWVKAAHNARERQRRIDKAAAGW